MARYSSSWLSANYGKPCQQPLQRINFAGSALTVHRDTISAWRALEKVIVAAAYKINPPFPQGDTGAYNCRQVTGGTSMSPHAWGVAADLNWKTNPYIKTPDRRKVIWGQDTDMSPAMIEKVRQIQTASGQRVWFWGGDWSTIKDAMHFQIIATVAELNTGITVPSLPGPSPPPPPGSGGPPKPGWKRPGDPIITLDDALQCLLFQGGPDTWKPLVDTRNEKAILAAANLANRAMVLQAGINETHRLTKGLMTQ